MRDKISHTGPVIMIEFEERTNNTIPLYRKLEHRKQDKRASYASGDRWCLAVHRGGNVEGFVYIRRTTKVHTQDTKTSQSRSLNRRT